MTEFAGQRSYAIAPTIEMGRESRFEEGPYSEFPVQSFVTDPRPVFRTDCAKPVLMFDEMRRVAIANSMFGDPQMSALLDKCHQHEADHVAQSARVAINKLAHQNNSSPRGQQGAKDENIQGAGFNASRFREVLDDAFDQKDIKTKYIESAGLNGVKLKEVLEYTLDQEAGRPALSDSDIEQALNLVDDLICDHLHDHRHNHEYHVEIAQSVASWVKVREAISGLVPKTQDLDGNTQAEQPAPASVKPATKFNFKRPRG